MDIKKKLDGLSIAEISELQHAIQKCLSQRYNDTPDTDANASKLKHLRRAITAASDCTTELWKADR